MWLRKLWTALNVQFKRYWHTAKWKIKTKFWCEKIKNLNTLTEHDHKKKVIFTDLYCRGWKLLKKYFQFWNRPKRCSKSPFLTLVFAIYSNTMKKKRKWNKLFIEQFIFWKQGKRTTKFVFFRFLEDICNFPKLKTGKRTIKSGHFLFTERFFANVIKN